MKNTYSTGQSIDNGEIISDVSDARRGPRGIARGVALRPAVYRAGEGHIRTFDTDGYVLRIGVNSALQRCLNVGFNRQDGDFGLYNDLIAHAGDSH